MIQKEDDDVYVYAIEFLFILEIRRMKYYKIRIQSDQMQRDQNEISAKFVRMSKSHDDFESTKVTI